MKKDNIESFINKGLNKHGDNFDYSLVKYVNSQTEVVLRCKKHDFIFKQTPNKHLTSKHSCPKCSNTYKPTAEEWIDKYAKPIHGNKYDYSNTIYENNKKHISIICHEKDENGLEHGLFIQTPHAHVNLKQGCPKCGKENSSKTQKMSFDEFKIKSNKKHKNKYKYITYTKINLHEKILIECPKHGLFEQMAYSHLSGQGCPECSNEQYISKLETELFEYIKSIYQGEIIRTYRKQKPYELDIFIPELNIGFEFNGLYWHCNKFKDNNYHFEKSKFFREIGIIIYHIYEDDWVHNNTKTKELLLKLLTNTLTIDDFNINLSENNIIVSLDVPIEKILIENNYVFNDFIEPDYMYVKKDKKVSKNNIKNTLNKIYNGGYIEYVRK